MATREQMLSLYRQIIRNARIYPSLSRDKVIEEIRVQFRKNATLVDPAKVAEQRQLAVSGLQQLQKFTTLDKNSNHWTVDLEQNPLGGPKAQ